METNKYLLLLLLLSATFSCNQQQASQNKNEVTSDTLTVKATDKIFLKDTTKSQGATNIILAPSSDSSIITEKQAVKSAGQLSDIYKKLDKRPQIFSLPANKDSTIICLEGTSIKIKASSFISEKTGKEITGNIQISVKEYYKLSDILLAKLSTTTDGNLLETAGMIYITAVTGNENCILKKGRTIDIVFPSKDRKEGMQLYTGDWKNDRQINWELLPRSESRDTVYVYVEQMPEFPGGSKMMKQFIRKSIKYPPAAQAKGIQGTVIVGFVVNNDGTIEDAKIERGIDPECDKAALDVVRKMPVFTPGTEGGKPVNVQYRLPINFYLNGDSSYNAEYYARSFEKNYSDTTVKNAGVFQISGYFFSSTKLEWINCDRLWKNSSTPSVNYVVQVNSVENCNLNIIFHRFKAIMSGTSAGDNTTFLNIPSGEEITLVAIKYFNDKPYLAVKETQTSSREEGDLPFQLVTMETLKSEMKKLDKLD